MPALEESEHSENCPSQARSEENASAGMAGEQEGHTSDEESEVPNEVSGSAEEREARNEAARVQAEEQAAGDEDVVKHEERDVFQSAFSESELSKPPSISETPQQDRALVRRNPSVRIGKDSVAIDSLPASPVQVTVEVTPPSSDDATNDVKTSLNDQQEKKRLIKSQTLSEDEQSIVGEYNEDVVHPIRRFFLRSRWSLVFFAVGLILLIPSIYLAVTDSSDGSVFRFFRLWLCTCWFLTPLVVKVLLNLFFKGLEHLSTRMKSQHEKHKLVLAIFYLEGAEFSIHLTIIFALCIVPAQVAIILADRDLFATYALTVFAILAMLSFSRALTIMIRMWISQDLGTRSFRQRVFDTLDNEIMLCVLGGFSENPLVWPLYEGRLSSDGLTDPNVWQRLVAYINGHHVSGIKPVNFTHENNAREEEFIVQISRVTAVKVFNKYWHHVERGRERDMARILKSGDVANTVANQVKFVSESPPPGPDTEHGESNAVRGVPPESVSSLSFTGTTSASNRQPRSSFMSSSNGQSSSARRMISKEEFQKAIKLVSPSRYDSINFDTMWSKIDPKNRGIVTPKIFFGFMQSLFEDRRSLSLTLQDSSAIVNSIDTMIFSIFLVVVLLISMALFGTDTGTTLSSMAASVVAWSFIFGEALRTRLNNAIFIFSVHPYDVGDTLFFNGNRHKVVGMHLLFTDFVRADGGFFRVQNTVLSSMFLLNYNTSENPGLGWNVYIPVTMYSSALVKKIRTDLEAWVRNHGESFTGITYTGRELQHPLELHSGVNNHMSQGNEMFIRTYVWVDLRFNAVEFVKINLEITELLDELARLLRENGVTSPVIKDNKGELT